MLNISLCTHTMGQPFFFGAIPIYGVLPYSIINRFVEGASRSLVMDTNQVFHPVWYLAQVHVAT